MKDVGLDETYLNRYPENDVFPITGDGVPAGSIPLPFSPTKASPESFRRILLYFI